jgi:hypothetical protein
MLVLVIRVASRHVRSSVDRRSSLAVIGTKIRIIALGAVKPCYLAVWSRNERRDDESRSIFKHLIRSPFISNYERHNLLAVRIKGFPLHKVNLAVSTGPKTNHRRFYATLDSILDGMAALTFGLVCWPLHGLQAAAGIFREACPGLHHGRDQVFLLLRVRLSLSVPLA